MNVADGNNLVFVYSIMDRHINLNTLKGNLHMNAKNINIVLIIFQ